MTPPAHHSPIPRRLAAALTAFRHPERLAAVTARVDDTTEGWAGPPTWPGSEFGPEVAESYAAALQAWRKNPLAKRIVDTVTDFCLGDGIEPQAPGIMGGWIHRFWHHDQNRMPLRFPELADELTRAGDLFLTLHRNQADGMSYVRAIPKDNIVRIVTAPNDWEAELAYVQRTHYGLEETTWLSPLHPESGIEPAVMLHYKINAVVGSALGESDLATLVPWLLRYSRMLEDRVRLNWALRAFLWIVTVPTNLVQAKAEQYKQPPEGGSVIVKDAQETWEPIVPNLHAFDARFDLHAVRQIIDAGAGLPPHWRGEGTDVNLATATAMERAATRHLRRRQLHLRHVAIDLAHVAYTRAYQLGCVRAVPSRDLIRCEVPDLNRQDNKDLAAAARDLAGALQTLNEALTACPSAALRSRLLDTIFRFAGDPLDPAQIRAILAELAPAPTPGKVSNRARA